MRYSEDDDTRGLGGSLGKIPLEQLPSDLNTTIGGLQPGEISMPKSVALTPTESGYHIVRLVSRIPAHRLDPAQDREQLERIATAYKQNSEFAQWIQQLRKEIYWEIKTDQ
jgi:peptidyl-prolyl cis-trans isomerase SurA